MSALRRAATSITTQVPGYPAAVPRSRATRRAVLGGLIVAIGLAAGLPAGSVAATAKKGSASSKASANAKRATLKNDLWATVNICDTKDHPDTIGIRGSMPGSGRAKERMYMRFQLQYFDQQGKTWKNNGDSGDSGFVAVGSAAQRRARESGRNFTVRPPRTGAFYLRGSVTFEWRRGAKVTRRERKSTGSGHPGTRGADPKGFSAAKCVLRAT